MEPAPFDMNWLDPSRDARHWEGLIGRVLQRAGPELARRAAAQSSLVALAGWARPALAATVLLAVLSAAVLVSLQRRASTHFLGLVEALGVSPTVATWLAEDRPPSLSELMLASEGDMR